jgi:hypothetical protein
MAALETETVQTETVEFQAFKDKLVIQFRKVSDTAGNTIDIQLHKVKKRRGENAEEELSSQLGAPVPSGMFPVGTVYKYHKNPFCIGFDIGGSYYEICFPD